MKTRVLFIERRSGGSPSLERVFRRVAEYLPEDEFDVAFQQVPYGDGALNVLKNLLLFRPEPAEIYHVAGHVTYVAARLPRKRTVITIPDLILLHIRKGLRRSVLKWLYFEMPLRRAARVTAISDATRQEIEDRLSSRRRDVQVISCPLTQRPSNSEREFNVTTPTILHIGTSQNKNLPTLVDALQGTKCFLRIVGRPDPAIRIRIKNADIDHEWLSDLDNEQMTDAYNSCDIVSFCTTYEGFGLPIIEAQAMGKVVITSDLQPHRCVAGSGAVFVDPRDAKQIRQAIQRVADDPDLRRALIEAGRENIEKFAPESIANDYADLYRRMMAREDVR